MAFSFRLPGREAMEGRPSSGIVHLVEWRRHDEGRVRADEGDMREPALVLLAEPADEFSRKEGGRRLVLRVDRRRIGDPRAGPGCRPVNVRMARGCINALCGKPRQPGPLVLWQELADAEAGQHAFIGSQPRIRRRVMARVGRDIGVAEERRIVAKPACRERDRVVALIERRPVAADPVVHLVKAGVEAGTRRPAGRRARKVTAKQHAFASELVGVRRSDDLVSRRRQTIAAPLVAGDEKNVRPRHASPSRLPRMEPDFARLARHALAGGNEQRQPRCSHLSNSHC